MCHRLCGLSIYGLKAHVREMSTPRKLHFGHGQPLPVFKENTPLPKQIQSPDPDSGNGQLPKLDRDFSV